MTRFKVIHSEDGCTIDIRGDVRNPEPTTAVIRFPGGTVEVSRAIDGGYLARLTVDDPANIITSRLEFEHQEYERRRLAGEPTVPQIPNAQHITTYGFRLEPRAVNPTGE